MKTKDRALIIFAYLSLYYRIYCEYRDVHLWI